MSYLAPEVRVLFDALEVGVRLPGGTFTSEQVRNWTVSSFQHVCELERVRVPKAATVLAAIDARSPGWPGTWTEPKRIEPGWRAGHVSL